MIPLFSSQQVRSADTYAINKLGIPPMVLMENAARSICDIMLEYSEYFANKSIGIVCGKGNNGGDGFALARHLLINGYDVKIISLGLEKDLKGEALENFRITKKILNEYPSSKLLLYKSIRDLKSLKDCSVIVDAMLGTGSRGKIGKPYSEIIGFLNSLDAFKIAVDVPTGLDLETSTGEIIFNADLTITLSEFKTGLFYGKGYVNGGTIAKGSIGIGGGYYNQLSTKNYLIEPEDAYFGLPKKSIDSHKYSSGKVLVIAGSGAYPGAACFTANAVLKSGAGSCFLAFPKSIKQVAQKKVEAAIVLPYSDNKKEFLQEANLLELDSKIIWADIIAIGPGLGREEATLAAVRKLISENKNKFMVIDADAIYALSNGNYYKLNLVNKILTPHHKEFADLLGITLEELEKDFAAYGRKFVEENNCWLVLKGAPSLVFTPKGEMLINSAGNPGMAKFGTGDVLTGIIAGFIAQSKEMESALISAVYLHSLSADLLLEKKTEYSFTAKDILENLPDAIKFIRKAII
ncbi:MAG: NAD(P)H-hydrate dehydratase [Ignavibacteriales bacterium]|nr:NAD(P)H-hydrate dehydratase [Ignavibacteriales bacterium]